MNESSRGKMVRLVFCCLTAVIVGGCAAYGPLKQAELEGIIEDVERKAHHVRQFQAEFVKTRVTSVFDKAMSVDGRLVFQQPGKFWLTL
ncbi:MAG: hypothetical protein FJY85_04715, partial [Deltaproteobacteria bacterium]|nr:hypothetical protein [Deltaproteobacteria bacterium]